MISAFPKDSILISASFEVFKGTRESLFIMVPLVMLIRTVINMIMMQGQSQHMKVVGDTILFFIGIYSLESLMLLVMEIPASAQELIANTDRVALDKVPDKFYLFSIAMGMADLVDYCTILVFHILSIVYLLLMSIAIILGGYVIFFATMFQVRKAFTVFVMIIFFLSLWPFIWYSIDKTFEHILKVQNDNGSAAGAAVSVIMLSLLKLCVPVAGFMMAVKAPVGMLATAGAAVKSGFSPFKASTAGAKSVGRAMGVNKTADYLSTPARTAVGNRLGGMRGIAQDAVPYAAYKTSQLLKNRNSVSSMESFQSYKSKIDSHAIQRKSTQQKVQSNTSSGQQQAHPKNQQSFATTKPGHQSTSSFAGAPPPANGKSSTSRDHKINRIKQSAEQSKPVSYERIGTAPKTQSYERLGFSSSKQVKNGRDL